MTIGARVLLAILIFAAALSAERYDLQFEERFALYGTERHGKLGSGVAGGDFDGDGIDDLAISAPWADGPGERVDAGKVYLFFGGPARATAGDSRALDSSDLTIVGARPKDLIGLRLALTDLDGNGRADLVIASMYGDGPGDERSRCGEAYVLFGRSRESLPDSLDLGVDQADLVLYGADVGDFLTGEIATGDMNGDGRMELALGAFYGDGIDNARHHSGEVHILFGRPRDQFPRQIDLARDTLPQVVGPEASDTFGRGVAFGDLDGDGRDELIIGAYYGDGPENKRINAGETFVIRGRAREDLPVVIDAALNPGFHIYGDEDGDLTGRAMGAADLDGDGKAELLVAAHAASHDPAGSPAANAGVVYIIRGRNWREFPLTIDLRYDQAPRLVASGENDHLGWPILSGTWLPEDQKAVLIAAKRSDGGPLGRHEAGEVFLVLGKRGDRWPAEPIPVSETASFSVIGQDEEDHLGYVGAILDWDGDGRSEIAVGAPDSRGWQNAEPLAGEVVVFFPPQ